MVLRLRLQRHGRKGNPVYWIVAANSKSRRDGKHIERIGTWNMFLGSERTGQRRRELYINEDRLKYWFANGAKPSKPVEKIMVMLGMLPAKPRPPTHTLLKGIKRTDLPAGARRRPKWTRDNAKYVKPVASSAGSQVRVPFPRLRCFCKPGNRVVS